MGAPCQSAACAMSEVPAAGLLHLVRRGGALVLYHAGTGEVKDLPAEFAGCRLHFATSGVALLTRPGFPNEAVGRHLQKLYCKGVRPEPFEGERDGLFIFDQASQTSTWCSDVLETVHVRAFDVKSLGQQVEALQVYHFDIGVNGARVWWATDRVLDLLMNARQRRDYMSRRSEAMAKIMLELGFPASHQRSSRRSLLSRGGKEEVDASTGLPLQFWSWSTAGLCCQLLYWMYATTSSKASFSWSSDLAGRMLDLIIAAATLQGSFEVYFGDNVLLTVLENGEVNLDEVLDMKGMNVMRTALQKKERASTVSLSKVLLFWYNQLQRPSRFRSFGTTLGAGWIHSCFEAVMLQLEVSTAETWWSAASLLKLCPVMTSFRHHGQLSQAYREAVVKAARDCPDALSAKSLLISTNILQDGVAPGLVSDMSSAASRMCLDTMMKFFAAGRQEFKEPRVLHWSSDGVSAGGDENVLYVGFIPGKKAALAPIQV